MGIGKRILSVLIGILFIISVSVLGGSLLAKQVLVKAISQAGIDTAISHRMMDAVFGYAGADDTQWITNTAVICSFNITPRQHIPDCNTIS